MKNKLGIVITIVLALPGILFILIPWLFSPDSQNTGPQRSLAIIDFPKLTPVEDTPAYHLDSLDNAVDYAKDQQIAWKKYAAPLYEKEIFKNSPKIVLILTNLGRDLESLNFVLEHIPQSKTLGLLPYMDDLQKTCETIRGKGREVLLTLPMEAANYPDADPGPMVLLTQLPEKENLNRLQWVMNRSKSIIGFTNLMGERFLSDKQISPILRHIKNKGYVFLESQSIFRSLAQDLSQDLQLPYLRAHFYINEKMFNDLKNDNPFPQIQEFSKKHGLAIVIMEGYVPYLQIIETWAAQAEKAGFTFIPLSNVYRNPGLFHYKTIKLDQDNEDNQDISIEEAPLHDFFVDQALENITLNDPKVEKLLHKDRQLTREISELQEKVGFLEPENLPQSVSSEQEQENPHQNEPDDLLEEST